VVAASTPAAARAGAEILEAGGNAVDAAVATAFALMVTDPAMTSLGGRSQILAFLRDGRIVGIDGATQQPAGVPPLGPGEDRTGYRIVPVPGNPAALLHFQKLHGKLPRGKVLEPAIRLAAEGFSVTPRIAEIWAEERPRIEPDPAARQHYLKADGSAYGAGDTYGNRALAGALRALAKDGPAGFYQGAMGRAIAREITAAGGYVHAEDLARYRPGDGAVVRTMYRGYEVLTLGRQAWGNTLVEMLNILGHFEIQRGAPRAHEFELLARIITQALEDRPQALGTLAPKPQGLPLELISSQEFARKRAEEIRRALAAPVLKVATPPADGEDQDTTHMSVMDAEGHAVSLTTSIGPRFGARVVSKQFGFFFAHSYRMRSSPEPGARDYTEMTPTIVLRGGHPVLAIGAAGSERIPGAILQVLSYVLDRGLPIEEAIRAPRVFSADARRIRLWNDTPQAALEELRRRGFAVDLVPREPRRHLGIVHAVARDPATGNLSGAADSVYDGVTTIVTRKVVQGRAY
jgi:gamma-glutamyltranspeptidase/glutathione hydrolase